MLLLHSQTQRHMSRVKRICVFEHSVMTNFNCACPAIQRGQGSGFLSEGSSWLTACMSEQWRWLVPNSLDAVHMINHVKAYHYAVKTFDIPLNILCSRMSCDGSEWQLNVLLQYLFLIWHNILWSPFCSASRFWPSRAIFNHLNALFSMPILIQS